MKSQIHIETGGSQVREKPVKVKESFPDESGESTAPDDAEWNIQELTSSGWRTINAPPIATRHQADRTLDHLVELYPRKILRLQEADSPLAT